MTRRGVASSLLWQASGNLAAKTISWFSTLLVIRLLSPDDFGLMAMAGIFTAFVMLIGDLDVGAMVVQAPAESATGVSIFWTPGVAIMTQRKARAEVEPCAGS